MAKAHRRRIELALASHYRCAARDVSVGLREVKLGLLPGSGGTQRLPRLVGPAIALEMMLTGAPVGAARAAEIGLVDRLLDGDDALAAAVRYARELIGRHAPPRRLRDRTIDPNDVDPEFFAERRARTTVESTGLLAPGYIVELVEAAVRQPFRRGAQAIAPPLRRCRTSAASRSLRHLFFAERPSQGAGPRPVAQPVNRVAVLGAGTMGAGIAISRG